MTHVVPIDSIRIGERVRKNMGDLKGLAESMKTHGLMHPVVLQKDGTLVAGHRRIEAARLLAWKEIPASVLSLDDLLAAERDENGQRKDFEPSEAVAIGRLLEEQHRAKIAANLPAQQRVRALAREAKKRGEHPLPEMNKSVPTAGPTDRAVSRALGMDQGSYFRAKKVVAAAEAEPEKYGDLPAQMDVTRNVSGAYRELKARQEGKSTRHALRNKRAIPQLARIVDAAIANLEGVVMSLESVTGDECLDAQPEQASRWKESLERAAADIRRFARRLNQ